MNGPDTNTWLTPRYVCDCRPTQNCRCNDGPVTGTGDNPLKALRVEPVTGSPETVEDYAKTVDFRFLAMQRWIENGENRLALETIARIEGDLQQIRTLLKGAKKLAEGATDCPTCGGKRTLQSNFMPHCANCGHPESVPCNAYCPLAEG